MDHNTFDRRIQLGASRRRREDAEELHNAGRWAGAIYLGGYAIECALKALICYLECENNFKDTRVYEQKFKRNSHGNSLHNLSRLLSAVPRVQTAMRVDRTQTYQRAWNIITNLWEKDQLRYWDKTGNQRDSERFITAIKTIHLFLLDKQEEAS